MDRLLRRVDAFLSAASDQTQKGDALKIGHGTSSLFWVNQKWFVNFPTWIQLGAYDKQEFHWYTTTPDIAFLKALGINSHSKLFEIKKIDETTCEYGVMGGDHRTATITACTQAEVIGTGVLKWLNMGSPTERTFNMHYDLDKRVDHHGNEDIADLFALHGVQ